MFENGFSSLNFDSRNIFKKSKKRTLRGKIPWKKISLSTETLFKEEEQATQVSLLYFSQACLIILLWWDQWITVTYHKTSSWYVLSILLSSQQTVLQATQVFSLQFVLFLLHCMSSTDYLLDQFNKLLCFPKLFPKGNTTVP